MEEEERVWWELVERGDIEIKDWRPQTQWIKDDFNAGKEVSSSICESILAPSSLILVHSI